MRRCALALAGLLALPVLAHAQTTGPMSNEPRPELLPQSRWAITPFIGLRVPYTSGDYTVFTESGNQLLVREERGGSFAVGVQGEYRLRGPFGLIGSATFAPGQEDIFSIAEPGDSALTDAFRLDGPNIWLFKAGLSARLPDPFRDDRRHHPAAFVYVAPALVWMQNEDIDGAPAFSDDSHHFALNFGADAVQRLGRGNWAISLGFEDFLTFFDQESFRSRDELLFAGYTEEPVVVEYTDESANLLLLRLGISYRH